MMRRDGPFNNLVTIAAIVKTTVAIIVKLAVVVIIRDRGGGGANVGFSSL